MKYQNTPRPGQPDLIRFMAKVELRASDTDCWIWIGAKTQDGYGVFCLADNKTIGAHRWSFKTFRPDNFREDLTCDHLCRNRACVNPYHIEMVTTGENALRGVGPTAINKQKTHCKRGHPLSGNNLIDNNGRRECRQCKRIKQRESYRKKHGKGHHTWSQHKGLNDD